MPPDLAPLEATRLRLVRGLLARRLDGGPWRGELSASALSTATAVAALALGSREAPGQAPLAGRAARGLIEGGVAWLVRSQNPDGGWGDTPRSRSNLSTTCLARAAFALAGGGPGPSAGIGAVEAAEAWLARAAGGSEPRHLEQALLARYGRDRTFSAPILTVLALAGRLGAEPAAWAAVPQLPFELAACPRRWFRRLRLPVVSYALPALIAIGLARHHRLPGRGPGALLRRLATARALRVLEEIQPASGGFLEAVPLSSFVALSLCAAGRSRLPVVGRALRFLAGCARPDGSWPIDSDLATWVTTLSVQALLGPGREPALREEDRRRLLEWLLAQQFRSVHPYTGAAPGGWAWTDRPGGVPDADDTAGALLALRLLAPGDARAREAARAGARWLLGLQNSDGGIPTFCRGWGSLPFDRSSPDLTAHALRAWTAWRGELAGGERRSLRSAAARALRYLCASQRSDGAWSPLWFGNEEAPGEENPTYGTSRVLAALGELAPLGLPGVPRLLARGLGWLLEAQDPSGGFGGAPGAPPSVEETGLALEALAAARAAAPEALSAALDHALERGAGWLIERTEQGRSAPAAPIGLYFAKLWYSEALYPWIFAASALSRLQRERPDLAAAAPEPARHEPTGSPELETGEGPGEPARSGIDPRAGP